MKEELTKLPRKEKTLSEKKSEGGFIHSLGDRKYRGWEKESEGLGGGKDLRRSREGAISAPQKGS